MRHGLRGAGKTVELRVADALPEARKGRLRLAEEKAQDETVMRHAVSVPKANVSSTLKTFKR